MAPTQPGVRAHRGRYLRALLWRWAVLALEGRGKADFGPDPHIVKLQKGGSEAQSLLTRTGVPLHGSLFPSQTPDGCQPPPAHQSNQGDAVCSPLQPQINLLLKQVSEWSDINISTDISHHQLHFTCHNYEDIAGYRSSRLFMLLGRNFLPLIITCISMNSTEKQD